MSERVVVVNASKMNYDHALDFSVLSSDVKFTRIVQMQSLLNAFKVLA